MFKKEYLGEFSARKPTGKTYRLCLEAVKQASDGRKVFYVYNNRGEAPIARHYIEAFISVIHMEVSTKHVPNGFLFRFKNGGVISFISSEALRRQECIRGIKDPIILRDDR
jgi:hypothetical protein